MMEGVVQRSEDVGGGEAGEHIVILDGLHPGIRLPVLPEGGRLGPHPQL